VQMSGRNIGDLLSAAGVSWGSFMGGFDLTAKNPNTTTGCARSSAGLAGTTKDYIATMRGSSITRPPPIPPTPARPRLLKLAMPARPTTTTIYRIFTRP